MIGPGQLRIENEKILDWKSQEEYLKKKKICINWGSAALPGMLFFTKVKFPYVNFSAG